MLLENGMEMQGDFWEEHSLVGAGVQNVRYSVFFAQRKVYEKNGSGAGNRLSPQAHGEECNEEEGLSIALNFLEFEIPNDFTDILYLHDGKKLLLDLFFNGLNLGRFFQIIYFCINNSIPSFSL